MLTTATTIVEGGVAEEEPFGEIYAIEPAKSSEMKHQQKATAIEKRWNVPPPVVQLPISSPHFMRSALC